MNSIIKSSKCLHCILQLYFIADISNHILKADLVVDGELELKR